MKRREFIVASTCAAAGLASNWAHAEGASDEQSPDTLNLALIGAGTQGKILLNAARQVPGVRILAIADIWEYSRTVAQRYLKRHGHEARAYDDFRALLAAESALHGVLIATPDSAHVEPALACLERNIHVYCEPPLAESLESAQKLVRAARASGKLFQVGLQRRSNPRYQHVQEKLLGVAKLPGAITAIQTQWAEAAAELRGWPQRAVIPEAQLQQHGYRDMDAFRNWTWYPQHCAGPFASYAVHQLDVCNWFLGQSPQAVLGSGGCDYYADRQNWDTMMSVFQYAAPQRPGVVRAACNVFTTNSAGGMRQYERFCGTEGCVQVSDNPHWIRIGREANAPDWDAWVRQAYVLRPEPPEPAENVVRVSGELERYEMPKLEAESSWEAHVANFCDAIRGTAQLACPVEAAWPSHVAVFQALQSARQQQQIQLPPDLYSIVG